MAGAMLEVTVSDSKVGEALAELEQRLSNLRTPLEDIAQYLHQSTDDRFRSQVSPDGSPWAPLAASTLARKRGNRILRESGDLQDTLRYQVSDNELAFGTDRPYGAIHQFGGKIEHAARSQQAHFSGNRFASKRKSDVSRWITRGASVLDIPARPYLGLSSEDETEVLAIVADYLVDGLEADAS